ncbi:MAG: preprotein translocase [Bacteroidetes bacterium RIFCSPLOWO2_12_FULL_35_15]|nr:MAG: preprotein translocase [Bacteroidetes bacterium RIFCSPLOWO2_12_FULL_35_15]
MNTLITIIGIFGLGGSELVIIGIIILLLFGGKKIPQLMKGLGQGINEFKKSSKGETLEVNNDLQKKD